MPWGEGSHTQLPSDTSSTPASSAQGAAAGGVLGPVCPVDQLTQRCLQPLGWIFAAPTLVGCCPFPVAPSGPRVLSLSGDSLPKTESGECPWPPSQLVPTL